MRKNTLLLALLVVFGFSCTKKDSAPSQELNLAIWGNYLAPESQQKFTNSTGIKLNITNYSSNEELLAKIQMGGSGIDMAVPSDYMVDVMTKLGLLDELQVSEIANFKNVAPQFLGQSYDPQNKYSVPYSWTTTGIAVNRGLYKGEIKGWKDLFSNPALAGKFALLDDVREVLGAALISQGFSVNTTNPKELSQAEDLLLKAKNKIKLFTSDTIEILKNKEVVAAQVYSLDALQTSAQAGLDIEYILPNEGSTKAIDNLVIFKKAKNKAAAYKLINFLLESENNVTFVKNIKSGPVLKTTRAALPEDLKNSTTLFPPDAVLSKLQRIQDLGESNKLYEDTWSRIKTR